MAIRENSTPILEQADDPPFLQESTVVMEQTPVRQMSDQLVDFVYRWRLLLAFSLVPVVLAAVAVSYDGPAPQDPALSGSDALGSQLSPSTRGVADDETESALSVPPSSTATVEPEVPANVAPPTTSQAATSQTTAQSTTAPPTTAAPTTTVPPTTVPPTTSPPTTPPPTTAPPTTAPPTTPIEACIITIGKKTTMQAEPNGNADRVGRAPKGDYPVLGVEDRGRWLLISADGTTGWISSRAVNNVRGDC